MVARMKARKFTCAAPFAGHSQGARATAMFAIYGKPKHGSMVD